MRTNKAARGRRSAFGAGRTVIAAALGVASLVAVEQAQASPADVAGAAASIAAQSRAVAVGAASEALTSASIAGRGKVLRVRTAKQLRSALRRVRPGQSISLAPGTYRGNFVARRDGTRRSPITLYGSRLAVLRGGEVDDEGYTLHLRGVQHMRLVGFRVRGGQKGIMLDQSNDNVLRALDVGWVGMEAVHFRNFSSRNVVRNSRIHDTGRDKPQYGEGVYFGTAESNWGANSGGKPDHSNWNRAYRNSIYRTTAEAVDVKEGTRGCVISSNYFDRWGSHISGDNYADSWVDLKGVGCRVLNNRGYNHGSKLKDGIQTHRILERDSGVRNVIRDNSLTVNAKGYGVWIDEPRGGNVVGCDNRVRGATAGRSNVRCNR